MNQYSDTVVGLRQKGTDSWAYEDDSGSLAFGPMNARTLFFDPESDQEAISSHRSASLGGTDSTEIVTVTRSLEIEQVLETAD